SQKSALPLSRYDTRELLGRESEPSGSSTWRTGPWRLGRRPQSPSLPVIGPRAQSSLPTRYLRPPGISIVAGRRESESPRDRSADPEARERLPHGATRLLATRAASGTSLDHHR